MAQFNIYLLAHSRSRVLEIQSHFLRKSKNKDKFKVYLMCSSWGGSGQTEPIYSRQCRLMCRSGIEVETVVFDGGSYMEKINYAQREKSEYSIKLDEDLWFNENVLDWMIDNTPSLLSDDSNLAVTPVLSNGIPTCDMFMYDFMSPDERAEVAELILKTQIPNIWGADYSHLNKATVGAKTWDHNAYYELVKQINHHFKGIHPVRVNFEVNRKINDIVLKNWSKLVNAPYESIYAKTGKHPYLCNSVFAIKTDTWRKIIKDQSLYRDRFDEVPLNLYREKHDLNWVFARNAYAMHMIYNTVGQPQYEHDLTTECLKLIRKEK